jgi:hypothetical protein
MRIRSAVAAFLFAPLIALAAAVGADDAAQPTDGPLAAVAPFVGGEWVFDGKWMNGEALKAREAFTWGLGNKFVEVRTFVSRNDGSGEYERYRGVFAVKDSKLVSYNFTFDGGNTLDEASVEGDVLKIRRPVPNADVPTVVRQEIERAGDDKFKWRVWLERDGKKDQIMDGEWTRAAKKA